MNIEELKNFEVSDEKLEKVVGGAGEPQVWGGQYKNWEITDLFETSQVKVYNPDLGRVKIFTYEEFIDWDLKW